MALTETSGFGHRYKRIPDCCRIDIHIDCHLVTGLIINGSQKSPVINVFWTRGSKNRSAITYE